jgi:hypothetical protein
MTQPDALVFLSLNAGFAPTDATSFQRAYREAARKLHPDNPLTGNAGQFHMLQQAKKTLELAYGW